MPTAPSVQTASNPLARGWPLLLLAIALAYRYSPSYEASGAEVAPFAIALMLALAGAALAGWRMLPVIAAGALIAIQPWPLRAPGGAAIFGALMLVAQAAFGGMLLRRSSRPDDLALDSWPALRRLIVAALACGVIGAIEELVSNLVWADPSTQRPVTLALVRFTADGASVLIGLPILLALFSPLAERWRARRRTVALPLLGLVALLLVAFAGINERDRQAAQTRFERDAEVVLARTQALLDAPVQAMMAMSSSIQAHGRPLPEAQFDTLAQPWLKRSIGVAGIGWLEQSVGAGTDKALGLALQHVLGNVPAVDGKLDAATFGSAVANALAQPTPAVSPVVQLGTPPDDRSGVVLFLALPATASGSAQRQLVIASVSAEAVVQPLLALRTDALRACLFDTDARAPRRRLVGSSGCESGSAPDNTFVRDTEFEYGGRRWLMRIYQPVRTPGGVWLFALPALAGGALLAVLLALSTGRVQRVQSEARTRSEALRSTVDARTHALAHSEALTHDLMDAVQAGVALVNGEGRIVRANAAFAELLGHKPDALRRRLLDELLVDDDRPVPQRFAIAMREAGAGGAHPAALNQSLRLRVADGKVLPALVTLRVQREQGRAVSGVCALHDLSDNLRRQQAERVLGSMLDIARNETAPAAAPRAAAPAAARATVRVLCIAAASATGDALRATLRGQLDLSVSSASDAAEGELLARTDAPRVVLLDLDLPGADGLELLGTLCDEGLPVIALSADPSPHRIDAAFAAGARAYLTQPLDARELRAAIDDLI